MPNAIVVVGGGIAGLLAARLLRQWGRTDPIVILERAPTVGGLLRGFDYGPAGRFDCGMQTFVQGTDEEVNKSIFDLLPVEEWEILSGQRRDISGIFFRGRLQMNAHYVDLRDLPEFEYRAAIADFFMTMHRPPGGADLRVPENMADFARARFGRHIGENFVEPAVSKIHGRPANEVHVAAAIVTPFDRVVLFDEPLFSDLMAAKLLRARLAYPEQRNLPLQFSSGRRSIYPKKFGSYRVVDALESFLRQQDVTIETGCNVTAIDRDDAGVNALYAGRPGTPSRRIECSRLIWCAGIPPLARLLGFANEVAQSDRPRATVIANLLLKEPPAMGDLFYFYCFDQPFRSYRVTQYGAYCRAAIRPEGYPLSIEMLVETDAEIDYAELAVTEAIAMNLVAGPDRVERRHWHKLDGGYPNLRVANMRNLARQRAAIRAAGLTNLVVCGVMAEENIFFHPEVLTDMRQKVERLLR